MKIEDYDFNEVIVYFAKQMNRNRANETIRRLDEYARRALISIAFAERFIEQRFIPLIIHQQNRIFELENRASKRPYPGRGFIWLRLDLPGSVFLDDLLTQPQIEKAEGLSEGIPE